VEAQRVQREPIIKIEEQRSQRRAMQTIGYETV